MTLPTVPLLIGGILTLAVNLMVYLDRMQGASRSCKTAREFCLLSFGFFLAATFALLDLMTQVWIEPRENIALAVLKSAGLGLALSTASALGFCVASRLRG